MTVVSIITPTYQEVENIPHLAQQVSSVMSATDYEYELIIADDYSADGTEAVCRDLSGQLPLRLLSRTSNRGLSPAVLDGISIAKGEIIVVMDADLSHPAEKIPEIVALIESGKADFVVGSRYIHQGKIGDEWPWWRLLNSRIATWLARPLVPLSDPMSGFFAFRTLQMPPACRISPIGYKIGLEILVKSNITTTRVCEVPIYFSDRRYGKSKMGPQEQINYLRHLRRLYYYRWPKRAEVVQFISVGAGGFVIDVSMYLLLQLAGLPHLAARAIAYWPAVTFNWWMNRVVTFGSRQKVPPLAQWGKYASLNIIGFLISWGTYAALTTYVSIPHLIALVVGVVGATIFNFIASDHLVYR